MNPNPREPATEPHPASPPPGEPVGDPVEVLIRIERQLDEIRGRLEAADRLRMHRRFSLAQLLGAMFQLLAVFLVLLALLDWVYQAWHAERLVKLAFAGVLQLAALTAFTMAREGH